VRKILRGLGHLSNWLPLLPVVIFLVMAQIMSQNRLAIIINSLDIGAWFLIVRAYGWAFYMKLRSEERHSPETYFLGAVLLNVTALAWTRMWSFGIILMGKPPWMINHWFQSFCYLLIALSYYYFLRIPENSDSRRYITYSLAIAVVLMGVGLAILE
jgi:hypothetical protein